MKRLLHLGLCLTVVILAGCAGLKPAPRFTTKSGNVEKSPPRSEEKRIAIQENMSRLLEDLLGTPYREGGSDTRGMDCSGLVAYVFEKAAGVALPHQVSMLLQEGREIDSDELHFGDLVFFRNLHARKIEHVGIYLGEGDFIHASSSNGVIISSLSEPYYRQRFVTARRILIFR